MSQKSGFTSIEILCVLIVLGILSAIAIPWYIDFQEDAQRKAAQSAVAEAQSRLNAVFANEILSGKSCAIAQSSALNFLNTNTDAGKIGEYSISLGNRDEDSVPVVVSINETLVSGLNAILKLPTCANDAVTGDSPTYPPYKIDAAAAKYTNLIDTVIHTLYDELIKDRLGNEIGQISYILFRDGRITALNAYSATSNKGQAPVSDVDLAELNQKLANALIPTGYKTTVGTMRLFFDREGNPDTNLNEDGSFKMLGGQGAIFNLTLYNDTTKDTAKLYYGADIGFALMQ